MVAKIIITGASGSVGQQLVPILVSNGCNLLLVGRNPSALASLFPDIPSCGYAELGKHGQGFEMLVHLAVLNNDSNGTVADFWDVNVGLLEKMLAISKQLGLREFINVTTFHAIDGNMSNYAKSKRAACEIINKEKDIKALNVFLPSVHGVCFTGKMSFLNNLAGWLQTPIYNIISAFVPTIHIKHIAQLLIKEDRGTHTDVFVSNDQNQNPIYTTVKRILDIFGALTILILFGLLIAILCVLIRVTSNGPGLFVQTRVGKNGALFNCYKIRTMKVGTKEAGTHELDSHVTTWLGSFLRKTKLDELPQIFNIFKGELSLVGPRPGLPVQTDLRRAREEYGVYSVLPGITGLAQINDVDMSQPERLARLDAEYIARRSLLLDLRIIFATALGSGQGDKISRQGLGDER